MFRNLGKILTTLLHTAPIAAKKLSVPACILALHQPVLFPTSVLCRQPQDSLHNTINLLEDNLITIERNGNFVGYAYCFADNLLISTSYQLQEKAPNQRHTYEFYQGSNKIKGTFKILGHFQNSTFIERIDTDVLKPLPGWQQREPFQISQVEIYLKKSYPSINHGYLVAQDAGYGIADGKGEIGSLILRNNKILGIVTHIGRDAEAGFLRFLQWKHFRRIVKYLKGGSRVHLGVSAQALQDRQGISIVRIAPNSPFKNDLAMGDFITKVNGQKVSSVQAFQRVCILEEGPLTLQILRQGGVQKVKVNLT